MRVRFERFGLSVLLETDSSFLSPDANESAPDSLSHGDASLEQPSPEVCSQPLYVVTLAAGMARLGHRECAIVSITYGLCSEGRDQSGHADEIGLTQFREAEGPDWQAGRQSPFNRPSRLPRDFQ